MGISQGPGYTRSSTRRMGQGKIASILQAKPHTFRTDIELASQAGITKENSTEEPLCSGTTWGACSSSNSQISLIQAIACLHTEEQHSLKHPHPTAAGRVLWSEHLIRNK